MRLRVAGVIVLLYEQPVSRAVRLSVDDVISDGDTLLYGLGSQPRPFPRRSLPCCWGTSTTATTRTPPPTRHPPGSSPAVRQDSQPAPTICPRF